MPYRSQAQSRYIHMKANEGTGWAKKFVSHSHGQKVRDLPDHKAKRPPPALSKKKR
jgi:hypothetical protein